MRTKSRELSGILHVNVVQWGSMRPEHDVWERLGARMNLKKVLTYLAIAFVIFYLFTQPANAAGAVRNIFGGISTGAERLSAFFTSLFSG